MNMRGRIVIALVCIAWASAALARPGEQWAQLALEPGESIEDRIERSAWFARQKMPDSPRQSCCGEADAYYADQVEVVDDKVYAIITDTRPDAPLGRPHIPVGTKFEVPPHKNKDTRADPNPTGRTIIFVRWYANQTPDGDWAVLCYLPDGGV